jgi:hypothetical protein
MVQAKPRKIASRAMFNCGVWREKKKRRILLNKQKTSVKEYTHEKPR